MEWSIDFAFDGNVVTDADFSGNLANFDTAEPYRDYGHSIWTGVRQLASPVHSANLSILRRLKHS